MHPWIMPSPLRSHASQTGMATRTRHVTWTHATRDQGSETRARELVRHQLKRRAGPSHSHLDPLPLAIYLHLCLHLLPCLNRKLSLPPPSCHIVVCSVHPMKWWTIRAPPANSIRLSRTLPPCTCLLESTPLLPTHHLLSLPTKPSSLKTRSSQGRTYTDCMGCWTTRITRLVYFLGPRYSLFLYLARSVFSASFSMLKV